MAALENVEGVIGSNQLPMDADVLASGPKLRVVSNFGVGFDNVDLEAATTRGVLVCNTPGVLTDAVADLTLGLILALARLTCRPRLRRIATRSQSSRGLRLGRL